MSFEDEKIDMESTSEERRKSVTKSIRTVTADELKKIGEEVFRYVDDPWREVYFQFIAENAGCTFYHALTHDGVNIVYCSDRDKGIWFMPGTGKGPLQEKGRKMVKEIIERRP